MFRPGSLYKHEKNTQIAMEILKMFYVKEKKIWKLKVRWYKISPYHAPRCMAPGGDWDERIEIPLAKYKEWKPMSWDEKTEPSKLRHLTFEQGRLKEEFVGE